MASKERDPSLWQGWRPLNGYFMSGVSGSCRIEQKDIEVITDLPPSSRLRGLKAVCTPMHALSRRNSDRSLESSLGFRVPCAKFSRPPQHLPKVEDCWGENNPGAYWRRQPSPSRRLQIQLRSTFEEHRVPGKTCRGSQRDRRCSSLSHALRIRMLRTGSPTGSPVQTSCLWALTGLLYRITAGDMIHDV